MFGVGKPRSGPLDPIARYFTRTPPFPMKMLSWPTTRYRRVSSVAAMALVSLTAVSCDSDPLPPAQLTESVSITTVPSGADVTDVPRGITIQFVGGAAGGGAVTYSSSNASVASVDANTGLVTTIAGGSTFIIATSGSVADSIELTVQFPVQTINVIATDSSSIRQEGTKALMAILLDTQGDTVSRDIRWFTLDEDIAKVDDDGVVQGVADGSVTIRAEAEDVTDDFAITVAGIPLVSTVEVKSSQTFGAIGQTFTATQQSHAQSGANIVPNPTPTWASSDEDVATVDATTGLVTLVGEGTAKIMATVDNGIGVDVTGSLEVRAAPMLVSGVGVATGTIKSGTPKYWALVVPAGAAISITTTNGPTGDGDLFLLKANTNPATPAPGGFGSSALACSSGCVSGNSGNPESIGRPAGETPAGTYPVAFHAWTNGTSFTQDVTGVTLTATITP